MYGRMHLALRRLIATLAAVVSFGCACSPRAHAASPGLYLTWNDCVASPAARFDLSSTCGSDGGSQSLVAAFQLASPLDSVVAIEITVDIQHDLPYLPAWWQLAPGGCRYGALSADADFTGWSACADFWNGLGTKSPPVTYLLGEPGGVMNRARIRVPIARSPEIPVRLEAGVLYYAGLIDLRNAGTSACASCEAPACFVLGEILIGRLPGSNGGDLSLTTAGEGTSNRVSWQGGGDAMCTGVPARPSSWGRLKALYR
jgi:hypothetical protein